MGRRGAAVPRGERHFGPAGGDGRARARVPGRGAHGVPSQIGEKGWFGLNWPKDYGGLGLTAMHQHLLMSEFEYAGVPGPDLTVTSVAP